ncbi:MAG: energy-coupling factor ABC transporter permease [Archaeoglobaceae archaeon]|nr:energy-coupling factor ABC transporter permease [Archaeoglobaceae archaeon]
MHIAEGFLQPEWSLFWYAFSLPILIYGSLKIRSRIKNKNDKILLAVSAGFIFVLSAMKIPSVTGSCSHPTGTGIAVVLFGPAVTSVLSAIVLLYQALLLAHGGITTLGANVASMGIIGPFFGWVLYRLLNKKRKLAVFTATAVADVTTYLITSVQLALAFPTTLGIEGFLDSALRFLTIFAFTQIPIALIEALIAITIFEQIISRVELTKVSKV